MIKYIAVLTLLLPLPTLCQRPDSSYAVSLPDSMVVSEASSVTRSKFMFGAIAGFNNGPYDLTFGMADTAGYGWFVAVDPQTLLPEDLTEVNGDPLESYSESDVRNVYHDQQTDSRIQYLAIELCASMHLTKGLHAYAGGGYARQTIQYKFFDPTKKRGQVGDYWIDSDSHPDSFNAMGGLEYLFAINLYLLAGVESYPHTVNAGFGYWW